MSLKLKDEVTSHVVCDSRRCSFKSGGESYPSDSWNPAKALCFLLHERWLALGTESLLRQCSASFRCFPSIQFRDNNSIADSSLQGRFVRPCWSLPRTCVNLI